MPDKENFAKRLRKLLKEKRLSQQNVADELNLPRNTIWRWINGQATPESNKLQNLATLLNISVDELLNGVPKQNAWVLHVEIGNTKEDFLDMAKLATSPVSAIITDREAGFLKIGGNYELWTDDNFFKKVISEAVFTVI